MSGLGKKYRTIWTENDQQNDHNLASLPRLKRCMASIGWCTRRQDNRCNYFTHIQTKKVISDKLIKVLLNTFRQKR